MGRFGWLLLCCALGVAGVARAEGCDGLSPADVASRVPFVAQRMVPVEAPTGVSFRHVDDQRLRLSVDLASAAPVPPGLRRSEYLSDKRREAQDSVGPAADSEVKATVGYEEPVSWTVQVRSAAGSDTLSRGLLTVKLRPTCNLLVRWDVLETPPLIGRIRDMNGAIDAFRGGVGLGVPSEFVPENYAPVGRAAFAIGVAVVLLAAAGCAYVFRSMGEGEGPIGPVRAGAAAGASAAALGLLVQAGVLADNVPDLRYADVAAALGASGAALLLAALTGRARACLVAFSLALSSGIYLASVAYLDWAPIRFVTMAAAMGLTVTGGVGLWAWSAFPAHMRRALAKRRAMRSGIRHA